VITFRRSAVRAALVAAPLLLVASAPPATGVARFTENGGSNASIRNCPPSPGCGFSIGTALQNDTFDRTYASSNNDWAYGYLYGSFKGCGWITRDNLVYRSDTGVARCSSSGTAISTSVFTNGEIRETALPDGRKDGVNAHIRYSHTNCTDPSAYANARPWDTAQTTGLDRYGALKDGAYVKFRYTSRNGYWAMVHDPYVSSRGFVSPRGGAPSDWYFVRRNCVSIG
jgi:hypothetical protein